MHFLLECKFNKHFPGLQYRVQTVPGGVENIPTDQIIVLSDSLPSPKPAALTDPEYLIGNVTLRDVTSAIFHATYRNPDAPTKGVETFIVNKYEWMDMFEMNWDGISNLVSILRPTKTAPTPRSSTSSFSRLVNWFKDLPTTKLFTNYFSPAAAKKTKAAPVHKETVLPRQEIIVSVEDRQKIASSVKTIFDENNLSVISTENTPIQENGKIFIILNSSQENLTEDEILKMTVISRKIEEVSNNLIFISPYVNKNVRDQRLQYAPVKPESEPRTYSPKT